MGSWELNTCYISKDGTHSFSGGVTRMMDEVAQSPKTLVGAPCSCPAPNSSSSSSLLLLALLGALLAAAVGALAVSAGALPVLLARAA